MGMFTNPLGHAGYPPGVTGTPTTQPSEVRAATAAEVTAGVLNNCYVSPATASSLNAGQFASPPVLGSTAPNAVHTTHQFVTTGANTTMGTSGAMTAGAITISTTAVTASSIIFLSANTIAGTAGTLSAPTASIIAGTSFEISSSSSTDTSTVNWWIIN